MSIRPATPGDLVPLQALIQRAYRGEASRGGWTHEADLLDGERIGLDELAALLTDTRVRLLIGWIADRQVGSVCVASVGDDLAYLGQLCVDPLMQADGYGKRLITAAEEAARQTFGATRIEMTVIEQRTELIAYYRRRSFLPTGERRDFPIPASPPLTLVVLEKPLT